VWHANTLQSESQKRDPSGQFGG